MAAFDYSSSFAGINNAIASLGKQNELAYQRQTLANLGQRVQAGDYSGAAQAAFNAGDATVGFGLLKLGEEAKTRASDANLVKGIFGGGATQPTLGALGQQPAAGYFTTAQAAESSNNPAAKNPNSSATGLYQFTDGTWADLAKANPQLGLTPDGRTDPAQQQKAMVAFTGQNAKILESKGLAPNDANLYMTHFLGAQGGPAFIQGMQANPNAPAASLVTPQAAAANKSVFYNEDGSPKTAAQVYTQMTGRFGNGSTALAQLQGGAPAPAQAAPMQVAAAGGADGTPAADVRPASGAPAQFVIPGAPSAITPRLANNPEIQQLNIALASAKGEAAKAAIRQRLEIVMKDEERRYTEGKAPEAVREWQWARQNGMTTANSPTAYAAELAAAKRDPDADVTNLRKEVQQLPSYKNLAQAAPIYRSMADTAGRNTKASDLNLVYGLGKIMDPTSVVREGEMIMVKNSAGMSEQLLGAINALNGGAALTPETRQALMQEAYSRMNTYKGQFDQDMQQYRGIVGRRGYNADDVIPNVGEFSPYEAAPKGAAKGQPAPSAAPAAPLPEGYADYYRRPDGSSPPLPSRPAAPPAPKRGELDEGYRFKGGDAGDPKNWVKVK